jgi:hypothetical protein
LRKLIVSVGLNLAKYFKDLSWAKAGAKQFGKEVANGVAVGFVSEKIMGFFRKDANRELAAVENDVVQRSSSLKRKLAGGFAAGAIVAVGNASVQRAKRFKDFMDTTQKSAQEVQEADNAMKRNGQTMEGFVSKLDAVNEARKDAVESNPELRNTFRDFGVTLEDLRNPLLSNLDLAKKMGAALQGMTVTDEVRNSLREIFGKGGEQFLTALKGFGEKSPLDIFANETAIKNIDRANTLIGSIWQSIKNIGTNIIGAGLGKAFEGIESLSGSTPDGKKLGLGALRKFGGIVNALSFGMWDRNNMQASTDRNYLYGDKITELKRKSGELPPIARATGEQFGPGAEGFQAGQLFKLKEDKDLAKITFELAEAQKKTDFERLDRLSKEKKLREEILGLLAEAGVREGEGFAVQGAELRVDAEKKQLQLDELQRSNSPGLKFTAPDELAKNNRFVGGAGANDFSIPIALQVQRDQLTILKSIDRKITPAAPAAGGAGAVAQLNQAFR